MRVDREPMYVLHMRPYRETSALVEMLTERHGRVTAVAKGVRAAKPRWGRGTLRPLQPIEASWQGRGELVTLTLAEPLDTPVLLQGTALLSALYLNELLTRLLPRHDPHTDAFAAYAACLQRIAACSGSDQAWTLRRFERDLLTQLGYAMALSADARSGAPLQAEALYSYDPECGPVSWQNRPVPPTVSGGTLMALATEDKPDDATLRELKRLMRSVLRHHLGGRGLAAWQMHVPAAQPVTPADPE